jgi:hypothetical protein
LFSSQNAKFFVFKRFISQITGKLYS